MINLIPPQGTRAIIREYLLRVGTVYGFLIAVAVVAGGVLLIPTYVLVSVQIEASDREEVVDETAITRFKEAEAEIARANALARQLNQKTDDEHFSELIQRVTETGVRGIQFQSFMLSRTPDGSVQYSVTGVAASRASLANFTDALRKIPQIKAVNLPISDLARDADLPFALTITLAPRI